MSLTPTPGSVAIATDTDTFTGDGTTGSPLNISPVGVSLDTASVVNFYSSNVYTSVVDASTISVQNFYAFDTNVDTITAINAHLTNISDVNSFVGQDVFVDTLTASQNIILSGLDVKDLLSKLSGMVVIKADGTACPSGWTEWTAPGGYYLVGRPGGGTANGSIGTGMSNLSDTNHFHGVTIPSEGAGTDGTPVSVGADGTYSTTNIPRSDIAPYFQVRLCEIP